MARYIEKGKSIFIPFKDGVSITDSQLHLRMYKTMEMLERYFPKNTGYDMVCEYAPVVRCKDCDCSEPCEMPRGRVWCRKMCQYMMEDGFCSCGERKDK